MTGNLIQYLGDDGSVEVGIVRNSTQVEALNWSGGIYELAKQAISSQQKISDLVSHCVTGSMLDYSRLESERRLLSPIAHPDPAHILISGTGLTHLGSADTRATMHAKLDVDEAQLTDSMRMFRLGLDGGKPSPGTAGAQPEWFYKGDGSILAAPGGELRAPDFTLDLGDEVEVAGIYVIGGDGKPYRLGFALGNEFSDHVTEKMNYLYLAHSKLRPCAIGPELALGELPATVHGTSRILRAEKVVWAKDFYSGEDHMTHSIANLEYHHFKYRAFLRPGDVHVHFFGTSTLSFGDGFEACEGDVFEVQSDWFGRALRNTYRKLHSDYCPDHKMISL